MGTVTTNRCTCSLALGQQIPKGNGALIQIAFSLPKFASGFHNPLSSNEMNSFEAKPANLAFPFWSGILQIFIAKVGRIYEKTSNMSRKKRGGTSFSPA